MPSRTPKLPSLNKHGALKSFNYTLHIGYTTAIKSTLEQTDDIHNPTSDLNQYPSS